MARKGYKTPEVCVIFVCADAWTDVVGASGVGISAKADPYFLDLF